MLLGRLQEKIWWTMNLLIIVTAIALVLLSLSLGRRNSSLGTLGVVLEVFAVSAACLCSIYFKIRFELLLLPYGFFGFYNRIRVFTGLSQALLRNIRHR